MLRVLAPRIGRFLGHPPHLGSRPLADIAVRAHPSCPRPTADSLLLPRLLRTFPLLARPPCRRAVSPPSARAKRSVASPGASSMIQRIGGESPDPGPDGGNPTLKRQGHCCGAPRPRQRDANVAGPARGCLVEVIGARLDRAKAKRRKASELGERARSGEAQYPPAARVYWRRGSREIRESYLERSAGFRASGSRPERKNEEQ